MDLNACDEQQNMKQITAFEDLFVRCGFFGYPSKYRRNPTTLHVRKNESVPLPSLLYLFLQHRMSFTEKSEEYS